MFSRKILFGLLVLVSVVADAFAQPEGPPPEAQPGQGLGQGPAPGQGQGFRRQGGNRGFRGMGGGGVMGQLMDENVRNELKISEEQYAKIQELQTTLQESGRKRFEDAREAGVDFRADPTFFQKMMEESRVESEAKLGELLQPEQMTRLRQLELRQTGLTGAITREDVANSLKLSDDQKAQIKAKSDEFQAKQRELGFFGPPEERDALRKNFEASVTEILSPEQLVAWTEKLGPEAAASTEGNAGQNPSPMPGTTIVAPTTPAPVFVRPTREERVPDGAVVVSDLSAKTPKPEGSETDWEKAEHSMSFRFAPWETVLKDFAAKAELTLDLTVVPPGTLNYSDDRLLSLKDVFDVLNGYLLQRGFILIKRDRFLVCHDLTQPVPPNLIPEVEAADLEKHGKNELMTIVIPLEFLDVDTAAAEAAALLGRPQGQIVPMTKTRRLIITDIGSNLRRIHRLFMEMGESGISKPQDFKSFNLEHISAAEAEKTLRDLFGLPARGLIVASNNNNGNNNNNNRSRGNEDRGNRGDWRDQWRNQQFGQQGFGPQGFGPQGYGPQGFNPGFNPGNFGPQGNMQQGGNQPAPATTQQTAPNSGSKLQLTVDTRNNAILATGSTTDLLLVENVIKSIDVESTGGRFTGEKTPQLEVYSITNADTASVMMTLTTLLPGLTMTEDPKSRRLHIYAPLDLQAQAKAIIAQLDGEGGSDTVDVLKLSRMDPVATAQSLRSLFSSRREDPPMIEPDAIGRQLMIRGTADQLVEVRKLLKDMGEDGTGTSTNRTNLRTISLGGRDPDEFLRMIQQMWPEEESPIRIVVPSDNGSIREQIPSSPPARRATSFREDNSIIREASSEERVMPALNRFNDSSSNEPVSEDEELDLQIEEMIRTLEEEVLEEIPNESRGNSAAPRNGSKKPIVVSPGLDTLTVGSEDLDALDRFEEMIQSMASAPQRRAWTVYYLRSADASEAAEMLADLMPEIDVSGGANQDGTGILGNIGTGLSSLGGNLMDMTGLNSLGGEDNNLRIVPEVRSNALFVSGPSSKVKQVEQFLKIIDAGELPEQLRDREPRMIPVEHADVNEVAQIVQDVYQEQLNPQGGGGGGGRGGGNQGGNPFAMLMAGGLGGDSRSRAVKMTVGVDTRTNTLIVSADDGLFDEVEGLVKDLDAKAKAEKRTIQIVTLENTNTDVVESALSSLLDKVTVRRADNGGNDNNNPFGQGFPGGINPGRSNGTDALRDRFRQRAMEGAGFGQRGGGFQPGGFQGGFQPGGFQGGFQPGGFQQPGGNGRDRQRGR